MTATSLWELRKRPVPSGVMSPLMANPAAPLSRKPSPSANMRATKKDTHRKALRGLEQAFDAVDRCMYRGGGICSATRAFKDCGARHSLCAMHRDRTVANQRRYDKKKRVKQTAEIQAEEAQRKEKRDRDRAMRAAKAKRTTENDTLAETKPEMSMEAIYQSILPSFQEWIATFGDAKRDTKAPDKPNAGDSESDSSCAWLQPFQSMVGVTAWHEDAVSQFLHEI